MAATETIVSVDVWPVDVPLTDPFVIARGALAAAEVAFVRVRLADGSKGFGEIAPFEALTGETRTRSIAVARALGDSLLGMPASEWMEAGNTLAAGEPHEPAARTGLECAIVDALARSRRLPLHELFGARDVRPRSTDITLPILAEERIDELAGAWYARGFRTFKLKVGVALDDDIRRVERLGARYPDVTFILDANQGFDRAGAAEFLRGIHALRERVALIEQPLARDDIDGLAALRKLAVAPICADESVFSFADAHRVLAAGAADFINLKIMKSGLAETIAIARAARAAGVGLMIGGMMETRLAMAFSLALVLGEGGISHLDLDTPLLMRDDPLEGGYRYDGPRLVPGPGFGVDMNPRVQPD